MKNLMTAFKLNNLKLTPQRIAVYEMLKNTKSHPSAESIYEVLQVHYPTMSLATVYKTLKTLIATGLVQELNVGEDNFRYDANPLPHPHITCCQCGKVDDIENADLSFLNMTIKDYTEYKVQSSKVYFYGVCPQCVKSNK